MAVTVADLGVDLRLIATTADALPAGQSAILARHLAAAEAIITERTQAGVPDALRDAAVVAVAAYGYDRPTAAGGMRFANAWRNSGAAELLSAYINRPIGVVGGTGD